MTQKVISIRNLNGKEDGIMKTTRFFAIIACAAAVAASCMKDDLKDMAYAEPIFSAVREDFGDPTTKTMLTDNYKVVWCSGDEVGVFDGSVYPRTGVASGSNLVNKGSGWEYGLRFKTTDNGASAGFAYEAYNDYKDEEPQVYAPGAADSYLLIHPMTVNYIANVSECKFRAWLSNSQKAEAGTYDSSRGFAVAKTSDLSEPVRFKNAVTLLEFVIPDSMSGKVKTIKVTPTGSNTKIAGDILIDYSGDQVVTSPWGNTAGENKTPKTDVTLAPKSGATFAPGKYYMVVCPGTYDAITVEATLSSGMVLKRESSKGPYNFRSGYVYGMGVIDAADYSGGQGLVAKACETSSSTVAFSWSYGGTAAVDIAQGYSISLYKDSECKELVVSHNISAGNTCWESRVPKFCFAGLEQNTTYYLKVVDADYGWESNVASAKTTTFDIVEVSTAPAAVNDVILAEDYSEMIGGGEAAILAAGACSNADNKLDPFSVMSGELPGAVFKKKGDEYNYKTYLANIKDTRLTDWGYYTTTSSVIYIHPGHVKIGTGTNITYVVTPALSSIPEGKSAELDVKITCAKLISADFSAMIAVESGTLDSNKKFSTLSNANITAFTVTNSGRWAEYTVTVNNVKKGNRLVIGAHKDVTAGSSRGVMYISDVTVRMKQISDIQ